MRNEMNDPYSRRKSLRTGALLILVALGLTAVSACTRPSPEQRAEWITRKVSSELDLTDEQKTHLDAVKQAMIDVRKTHKAERQSYFERVKQLILSEHLDAARVKALMAERQKQLDSDFDSVFEKVAAFHASLSADQKQKAVDLIEKYLGE